MNTEDRDGWLAAIPQFASPNDLLSHHAQLELYIKQMGQAVKNAKAVVEAIEKRASTLALGDDPDKTVGEYSCGSINKVEKTIHNVTDWDAYYAFIAADPQNRMQGFLHKKEGATTIARYLDEHGELPPGCETRVITDIKVKSVLPSSGDEQ